MGFECGCDEYTKEQWGCEKPAQVPIYEDEQDAFYNCPWRFVSASTIDFLQRYNDLKNGIVAALPYNQTLNRFLEAVHYFDGEYEKARKMKDERK
jgi:hypothetical protein